MMNNCPLLKKCVDIYRIKCLSNQNSCETYMIQKNLLKLCEEYYDVHEKTNNTKINTKPNTKINTKPNTKINTKINTRP